MKVLLVNPYNVGKFGLQNVFQVEPLGLEYLAAAISTRYDTRVQDMRWRPNLERTLRRERPDLVGISCLYTSHTGATWDVARRVKAVLPETRVIVGGQPPTLAPQFFASPDIDAIVRGDGEATLEEVCRAMEEASPLSQVAGLTLNGPAGQTATGDRAQRPMGDIRRPRRDVPGIDRRRHYLSFARPLGMMEITRGCPFRCNFCSIWKMADGKVRSQAIDTAVAELATLPERSIFFADDHFFANPRFAADLGRTIAAANLGKIFNVQTRADALARHPELIEIWQEAGLNAVFLGLEGHSDHRLREVNKGSDLSANETAIELLQKAGVGVVGNLMIDPGFGHDDFAELRDYVASKQYFFAAYCIATPFPGTDLWRQRQLAVTSLDFELYDIQHAVTRTALPLEKFYEEYASCWRLSRSLEPAQKTAYKVRRVLQVLFKEGLNFELLRNVRRFEKIVADPQAYLEDHQATRPLPWTEGMAADASAA